jgi:hypothetical protein
MTAILRQQGPMSFIAPHVHSEVPPQYPQHYRPPLIQLQQNQAPSAQHVSHLPMSKEVHNPFTNFVERKPYTPSPDVGGSSQGIYRNNGYLQRSTRPRSPLEEISPKHVVQEERKPNVVEEADQIAPYLQIPPEINSSKGSLSEFAARVWLSIFFFSP